ncbi:hypothetical protein Sa4125_45220 [Aureimonas sp. SA4125]|uniref:DUF1902 domain-containing protein n=1 Tax=Aureimonas sp. SA4125 TaxID=2826993 RepID=UPI001CC45209|nr:DUF1902 domain-containing protein [Aureimonas sp. SA4125]BDA86980.1 hypothetical protein Sa4125_45220 [Aureimonas sp. SA4125]
MGLAARPTIFMVSAIWDADASVWAGSCDAVPVAAEADTLDALLQKIGDMTSDLLADNHPGVEPASVFFQLSALRELERHSDAA